MSVGIDSCGDQDLKPSWSSVMSWYFGMAEMSQKTGVNRSRGQQKDRDPLSHTAGVISSKGFPGYPPRSTSVDTRDFIARTCLYLIVTWISLLFEAY